MSTTRDDLLLELYEKQMAYREGPTKEELHKMLSEANREREASNKRLQELESSLKARGISIIPKPEKKKPLVINTKLKVEVVDRQPKRKISPVREPLEDPVDDGSGIYGGMALGVVLSVLFCIIIFFVV